MSRSARSRNSGRPRGRSTAATRSTAAAQPVLPAAPAPTIRPSRASRWRAGVLIGIHLLIAAHIAHWLTSGRTMTPVEPSEAMALGQTGMVNAGVIFFAAVILLTAVFGRWFCGWACHLVALQDLSRWLLEKVGLRPQPLRSRLLAWVPAIAFFYMFLWPAVYRLAIGDRLAVRGTEWTTEHFWATFPGWTIGILTFLICGFACIWFLGAKGFCTYACPYGAAFSAVDRLAPLRVRVTDACEGCGHCTAVCTSNVRVHEEVARYQMVVDPGCMKCGDCVSVCPNDALYFGFGRLPIGAPARAPERERRAALSWAEEGVAAATFLAVFLSVRGLYGEVPFLMSLGTAAVGASLALLGLRLARRRDFAWRHTRLRSAGRLTGAGRAAVGTLAVLTVLLVGAGSLRATAALADRDLATLLPLRARVLDPTNPPVQLDGAARARIESARRRWSALERYGRLPWRGAAHSRAILAYLAGDLGAFPAAARRARERGEDSYELARLEARAAAERGDLAALRAAGERAIAQAPGRPEPWSAQAALLTGAGDLDGAADVLARARAALPDAAALAYDSGVVSAYQGRSDLAIGFFSRALELDPTHRPARENLAGMLASVGRYDAALVVYEQAIADAPQDAELEALRARVLVAAGRTREAVDRLRGWLEAHPDSAGIRSLLEQLEAPRELPAAATEVDGFRP